MASKSSSIVPILCLIVSVGIITFCNAMPTEEPNKENNGDTIRNENFDRSISQIESGNPLQLTLDETREPSDLNEKVSSTDIKEEVNRPIENGVSSLIALNGRRDPIEISGQSGAIEINQPGSSTQLNQRPAQIPQVNRPNVLDNNDYDIINRLRLPFRSFEDIPMRSFYDTGIRNTPLRGYRGNNFNEGPYSSNRGYNTDDAYRSYLGPVEQRFPFIPQQDNSRRSPQLLPEYRSADQHGRQFLSPNGQNVVQRPILRQYNVDRQQIVLPRQISYENLKPLTEHRGNNRPVSPPYSGGTFAIQNPTLLRQESDSLNPQQNTPDDGSNFYGYRLNYGSPRGMKCHPNQTWKALVDQNAGSDNRTE